MASADDPALPVRDGEDLKQYIDQEVADLRKEFMKEIESLREENRILKQELEELRNRRPTTENEENLDRIEEEARRSDEELREIHEGVRDNTLRAAFLWRVVPRYASVAKGDFVLESQDIRLALARELGEKERKIHDETIRRVRDELTDNAAVQTREKKINREGTRKIVELRVKIMGWVNQRPKREARDMLPGDVLRDSTVREALDL